MRISFAVVLAICRTADSSDFVNRVWNCYRETNAGVGKFRKYLDSLTGEMTSISAELEEVYDRIKNEIEVACPGRYVGNRLSDAREAFLKTKFKDAEIKSSRSQAKRILAKRKAEYNSVVARGLLMGSVEVELERLPDNPIIQELPILPDPGRYSENGVTKYPEPCKV